MMKWNTYKYLFPVLTYVAAWMSFQRTGIWVWLPVIYGFVIIPLIELCIKPDEKNLDEAEEAIAKNDQLYDFFLYIIVPLQYIALFTFLQLMQHTEMSGSDRAGHILVMGLLCGIFGINVAHELGHRVNKKEQFLSKMLLLTSMYMHFTISHNRGHHKYVGTPQDPASAQYDEPLYFFWIRSISGVYAESWRIANTDLIKKGQKAFHWKNEMLQLQIIQILFCAIIYFVFGLYPLIGFLIAAGMGILLLETVNYIQHYGLRRKSLGDGKFERAMPHHSWNSNHVIGRMLLFELSRHSDHHYMASRKYHLLRHHDNSPQLPTGYPGSMLLAIIPPLWFRVMNKKIKQFQLLNH